MNGADVKEWRRRTGYTQKALQEELGLKSRTSISTLENQEHQIPRTMELALAALEIAPLLRCNYGSVSVDKVLSNYPAISETQAREIYNVWRSGKFVAKLGHDEHKKP